MEENSQGLEVQHHPENLSPVEPPRTGLKSFKPHQVAPIRTDYQERLDVTGQDQFATTAKSNLSLLSPAKKPSDSRGVLNKAPSLGDIADPPAGPTRAMSMRDPSDAATERSKGFNAFFGLFFASGGLFFGYSLAILGPLGEKWLKFNFGITDDAAMFLGLANLA